jgi:hypothetical protein
MVSLLYSLQFILAGGTSAKPGRLSTLERSKPFWLSMTLFA